MNQFTLFSAVEIISVILVFILVSESLARMHLAVRQRKIVRSVKLVLLAVLAISVHLDIPDTDMFLDQRGAAIAVATLFGGIWVGSLATVAELVIRLFIGGSAVAADSIGILVDYLVSLAVLHFWLGNDPDRVNMRAVLLAGFLTGVSEAVALLYISPFALGWRLFTEYGMSLLTVQFISAGLLGWLLISLDVRERQFVLVQRQARELRDVLHQAIDALTSAMMFRDRTTAGHEKRVADLAVKVGRMLGMDEDRLEGLSLAAVVHDIGQIQVPAEILSRTRALSKEEFELIKLHTEAGYEILKDVRFPWPIAEIVRQHHENVDGSGYPRGLKGDELLLEARIIRACDMLEAMLSHRPFRKAYTVEQAIGELQSSRGSELDAAVVDCCIRLLRDEHYEFPSFTAK